LCCPTGKTPNRWVNWHAATYSALPKFGNGVCVAHPGSSLRGDRTSSLIASWACGGRGSVGTRGAGRAGSPCEPETACGRAALSSSSRQHSCGACAHCCETLWHQANVRTAKPCGPDRRCYGQAFAEVWSVQPDQPHRQFAGRGRPEGIRLPGEHGISRQPTAQGRPSDLATPVCCCAVFLRYIFAQQTVGASRHPAFPAPLCP
jgi:hypothetical protein